MLALVLGQLAVVRDAYLATIPNCPHGQTGVIVTLRPEARQRLPSSSTYTAAEAFADRVIIDRTENSINHLFSRTLDALSGTFSDSVLERIFLDADVAAVEADCILQLDDPLRAEWKDTNRSSVSTTGIGTQGVQQGATWGIDRIDSRAGRDQTYNFGTVEGENTIVYVLDTGIRISHSDFSSRAVPGWSSGCSTASECADSTTWAFGGVIDDRLASAGCSGHGTHCASTVGGTEYGVAKKTTLVAVQVLSCSGSGSYSGVAAGIEWSVSDAATNHPNQPAVISMSLGGGRSDAVNAVVDAAHAANVVVVAAAGNENSDACSRSPASAAKAITVGSTTMADAKSSFSNHGPCVDIQAPGSSITAAWVGSDSGTRTISGTSMATPHVAGAVALLRGKNAGMSADRVDAVLKCMATRGAISAASPACRRKRPTPSSTLASRWPTMATPTARLSPNRPRRRRHPRRRVHSPRRPRRRPVPRPRRLRRLQSTAPAMSSATTRATRTATTAAPAPSSASVHSAQTALTVAAAAPARKARPARLRSRCRRRAALRTARAPAASEASSSVARRCRRARTSGSSRSSPAAGRTSAAAR